MALFGGIEAGGTKFVCVVGDDTGAVRSKVRIETRDPEATIGSALDFFSEHRPDAVGIASFGPLELRRSHPDYGKITTTPKPGWQGVDLVSAFGQTLNIPVALDTDVNGAALGEWRWGAGRGLDSIVYVTVGTGIGGGAVASGRLVHGLVHPEMGHVGVRRQPGDDFAGICPYHGDCLEGMACGPAIFRRWGRQADELGELLEEAVDLEAAYLASGFRQIVYILAPQRIIVGGGVSKLPGLLPAVKSRLVSEMAGYALQPEHVGDFVVNPGLGDDSGVVGALALADLARRGE